MPRLMSIFTRAIGSGVIFFAWPALAPLLDADFAFSDSTAFAQVACEAPGSGGSDGADTSGGAGGGSGDTGSDIGSDAGGDTGGTGGDTVAGDSGGNTGGDTSAGDSGGGDIGGAGAGNETAAENSPSHADFQTNNTAQTTPRARPQRIEPRPVVRSAHGPYERDEILAVNADADVLGQISRLGFIILGSERLAALDLSLTRLRVPAGWDATSALRLLRGITSRAVFDFNHIYRAAASPSASARQCQDARCYGIDLIGWSGASQSCSTTVKIGMLDTAVDTGSPALAGQRLITHTVSNRQNYPNSHHGTAVASLIVGKKTAAFSGLLPAAELYAADVFVSDAQGEPYTSAVLMTRGLDWLLQQDVAVINISITGPNNSALRAAIYRIAMQRKIIVAAAGNGGPEAPPAYPAAFPEAIAVTAVDWRLRPYQRANQGDYLALAAPGVGIWTPAADGSGQYNQGTSFATPYVTAVAAATLVQQPGLQSTELTALLGRNARDLGPPGKDDLYGWGLVQSKANCDIGAAGLLAANNKR